MRYEKIAAGRFVARPNRFMALVDMGGRTETVHVKNTGRCRELLVPGARVYLSDAGENAPRKTRYDLVAVEKGGLLINMDSQAPNAAVREFLEAGGLVPGAAIKPEFSYGDSRFDFAVVPPTSPPELALLEVKGVTLERDGVVLFPDAPTQRGTKHLRELALFPGRAWVMFVVQMEGPAWFAPNEATDPAFAAALRAARDAGVEILAYDCLVTPDSMTVHRPIEVRL